ncbi:MAG TPA: endonuclease III [Thermoplasmata archaeon]|nr:endonuclease III [Thermoplasmata archaeon]
MTPGRPFDWVAVLDRLSEFYRTGDWRTPYLRDHAEDPFQVMIGTILSQRTRDEQTDVASARLFARFPDAPRLAAARPSEIEPLIRAIGFYHTKARTIRSCARELLARFDGVVPRDFEALTSLPGVGPKTANCVLVFGYGIPAIPVDTHVHRIANRLGVVRTERPEETEARLREVLPREYWIPINPLLVQHGQNVCRPIGPRCPVCPIADLCATGRALSAGRDPPRPEDRPRGRRRGSAAGERAAPRRPASRRRGTPTPPRRSGSRQPSRRGARRAPRRSAGSS